MMGSFPLIAPSFGRPVATTLSYRDDTLANADLTRYWRMNDASGLVAVDSAGNFDGAYTATGITYGETGPIVSDSTSKSVSVNGTTGYVDFGLPSPATGAFTVELWMYIVSGRNQVPLSTKNTSTALGYDMVTGIGSVDGAMQPRLATSTGGYLNGLANVSRNEWHHFALVFTGTQFSFFCDGTHPAGSPTTYSGEINHTQNLLFGKRGGNFFPGRVAEIAHYSTAKSVAWAAARNALGRAA